MVAGIGGSCAAYMIFCLLPSPWNLWIASVVAANSLGCSFYGLWRWHVYQKQGGQQ